VFPCFDQALKQLPREKVQLATKFGIAGINFPHTQVKGTPEYVRSSCEASLKRLDVEYIDLYYQHRVDQTVPIEETVQIPSSITPFLFLKTYYILCTACSVSVDKSYICQWFCCIVGR